MPGWSKPTKGVTRLEQLPTEARRYIQRLEEVSEVECAIVSTGSDRTRDDRQGRFGGRAVAGGVALLFVPLDEPHHRGGVGAEQLNAGTIARTPLRDLERRPGDGSLEPYGRLC